MRKILLVFVITFFFSAIVLASDINLPPFAEILKQESYSAECDWLLLQIDLSINSGNLNRLCSWRDLREKFTNLNTGLYSYLLWDEPRLLNKYKEQLIEFTKLGENVLSDEMFASDLKRQIPIRFVKFKNSNCLLATGLFILKDCNTLRTHSDDRLKMITPSVAIPCVAQLFKAFQQTNIDQFGVLVTYGIKDFSKEGELSKAESICFIATKENLAKFINLEITDQELASMSDVFSNCSDLASEKGTRDFKKVNYQ